MRLAIWSVRVMVGLVLGASLYRLVFSESLQEFLAWLVVIVAWALMGVLWLIRLEQIHKRDTEHILDP